MLTAESFERDECARKLALLQTIQAAMSELVEIHQRELESLRNENFTRAGDMQALLQVACVRKAHAIEVYREHIQAHGC